jgi:Family of unknown function (DUF6308)
MEMSFRRPAALLTADDDAALQLLRRYYGPAFGERGYYTGSVFDTWDSTGTRASDADRFTADDLGAVTFLSVEVDPGAAYALLSGRADMFSDLLTALGPDRDLADEAEPLDNSWAGWELMYELQALPGVGPTIASKLLARKRPRLRPIYDSVVATVTDTHAQLWEPLRLALRADDLDLHRRLLRLHAAAGLPADVSALRVLDVIAWLVSR